MSDKKDSSIGKQDKGIHISWVLAALVVTFIVAGFYFYQFGSPNLSSSKAEWGAFGDYFGGVLNPILAFFSFVFLLVTIRYQLEQLSLSREQNRMNGEELKLTREELEKSSESLSMQAEILKIQQFETTFFNLLHRFEHSMDYKSTSNNPSIESWINTQRGRYLKRDKGTITIIEFFFPRFKSLKILDDYIEVSKAIEDNQKQMYLSFCRASISLSEMNFYRELIDLGIPEEFSFLEKYSSDKKE